MADLSVHNWPTVGTLTSRTEFLRYRLTSRLMLGLEVESNVVPVSEALESPPAFVFGAAGELGTDISTFPDLDTTFSLIGGRRALAERVARRFVTPRGALWKHPSFGCDLRRFLNAPMTQQKLQQIKQEAEAEAEQDEQVLACEVFASFDEASGAIVLRVGLTDADGPFIYTAGITQLGIELLEAQD